MKAVTSSPPASMSVQFTQTWLPTYIGTRGYHVFNYYGRVDAGPKCPHASKMNEKLLGDLFEYVATLGDTPVLLVGDFQTNPADSHTLGSMLQTGTWHDLGGIFTDAEWTFQKDSEGKIRTRIDLAICNSVMLPHVRDVQILRDTGLPGHCPLQLKLDFPRELDHMQVYRLAAPLHNLQPARDERQRDIIECSVWDKRDLPFLSALKNGDIDSAFDIWSTAAEDYCFKLAESQDIVVTKKHRGRGRFPKVVTIPIQAPQGDHSFGAHTVRIAGMLKLQRRLQQLRRKNPSRAI